MNVSVAYRTEKGISDIVIKGATKVEKLFVKEFEGDPIQVIRVYTNDHTWRTWVADSVINIFISNY